MLLKTFLCGSYRPRHIVLTLAYSCLINTYLLTYLLSESGNMLNALLIPSRSGQSSSLLEVALFWITSTAYAGAILLDVYRVQRATGVLSEHFFRRSQAYARLNERKDPTDVMATRKLSCDRWRSEPVKSCALCACPTSDQNTQQQTAWKTQSVCSVVL